MSINKYDVIIAGGGTAGSAAAITAGRLGLSVLIIEAQSYLGGTSTGGLVTPMMWNHLSDEKPLNMGLTKELLDELRLQGDADRYFFNPFAMKNLLEQKAIEAKVTILYESIVTEIDLNNGFVSGITAITRSGKYYFSCKTLIDATGDAHASALAGVNTIKGREGTNEHQAMSLRFVMGGLDIPCVCESLKKIGGHRALWNDQCKIVSRDCSFLKKFAIEEKWPQKWINNFGIQFFEIPSRPNELWFNCPRLSGFDPLDPFSLSAAYIEGRASIVAYIKLFNKHITGAENVFLCTVASQMGIREGRRIVGKYVLSIEDFKNAQKFKDGICFNRYSIDIHLQNQSGFQMTEMKKNNWQEIPLRCLIPEKVGSLIVAGRCISSDFVAQSSYRIIPNCHTLGQAAAVACMIAKQDDCDVNQVDGTKVRRFMVENAILPIL